MFYAPASENYKKAHHIFKEFISGYCIGTSSLRTTNTMRNRRWASTDTPIWTEKLVYLILDRGGIIFPFSFINRYIIYAPQY